MKNPIRYTALLTLLLLMLTASAQQTHTLTCKVMPNEVCEAFPNTTVNVWDLKDDGTRGDYMLASFKTGDGNSLTVATGKRLLLTYRHGSFGIEKWMANGQLLGTGNVVEYYEPKFYETYYLCQIEYTMPDEDVEIEAWLMYDPLQPGDPGDGRHRVKVISNAGENMKFTLKSLTNANNSGTAYSDGDYYYAPAGEMVAVDVECNEGWRPRRVEADGVVVYEGDGMYDETYETVFGAHPKYLCYYVHTMPAHDVVLYVYGEFRPDALDHDSDNDLPHNPGSNGWDPATGEVTITNNKSFDASSFVARLNYAINALMEREQFTAADIRSLVVACDMTPTGENDSYNDSYSQLSPLFTSSLPTYHLERIDLSRTWEWGFPHKTVWDSDSRQYVPISFKDGTPYSEGTVSNLFNTGNNTDVSSLRHLILPACINGFVGNEAFMHLEGLQALTLFSATPPKVDDDTLDPLPTTLTLYVPAVSIELYKAHPYWSRFFDIRPIDESQVTDLTVYLPSDHSDGRYADMSIILRNSGSGETQQYVVDDRSDYTFRNLPRSTRYDISLVTPRDVTIATADSVYTYQRYVATGFDAITPLHNLTLTVKADGRDVTGQCGIAWTTADGSPLGAGNSLKWQPASTTVGYDVSLPPGLASSFFLPPHGTLTVGTTPDQTTIDLQRPMSTVVSGQVTDDSGRRVSGALVNFTLPINDEVSRIYTTVTDGSGKFSLDAVQGAGVLTVSGARYITWRNNVTLPLADPLSTHIVLRKITGPVIHYEMPYTLAAEEGEEADKRPSYPDMDNVDIEVYNLTTGQALENVSVQYPQIVLIEGAKGGDHLRLTATSRTDAFKAVETTTALDSNGKGTATLAVTAWGGLHLRMEQTDNVAVSAHLYDARGDLFSSIDMSEADMTVSSLPDGEYTVTMLTTTELFAAPTRLAAYTDMGLVEGTDYVQQKAMVSSGIIKRVSFATVPVLDETRFYYIDTDNSTFAANKSEVSVGSNFSLRTSISLKPEYEGRVTAAQLVVDLPAGTTPVAGSAMTGQRVVQFTQQDRRVIIPIPVADLGLNTRFAVQTLTDGVARPTAWLRLTIDGKEVKQPLGTAYVKANGITISVPEVICEKRATIWGYAPALSHVTVQADNMELGNTMAHADGYWVVDCQLPEQLPNLARLSVSAHIQTPDGTSFDTEAHDMSYDIDGIVPEHVYLYATPNCITSIRSMFDMDPQAYIDFDFRHPEKERPGLNMTMTYYDFTYYVQLNTADTTKVKDVILILMINGELYRTKCVFNPERQMWMKQIQYVTVGYVPTNVSVEVIPKKVEYKVDSGILHDVVNVLPYMQGCLQETIDLIDSYFTRFDSETDPDRLEQLFAEFNELFGIDPDMELLPEWQNLTWEQYLVKLHELAESFSFDQEGFLNASIYDMQMEGITVEHTAGLTPEALLEEGYDEVPTTDGLNIYLYYDDEKMIIVDMANDLKITYDMTNEQTMANLMRVSGISKGTMQENLDKMNTKFAAIQRLMDLIQSACLMVTDALKIKENIKMCNNAMQIYENAKRSGVMAEAASKELARVTREKGFWEGIQNWLNTMIDEGPNVSTAFAAFTKGEGFIAKAAKVAMAGMKCIEKVMSWAALIGDVTDGINKVKGLIDEYNKVPDPCKDDYANASRIRSDIMGYGGWTSALYLAVILSDVASMTQVNVGLTSAAAPPPGASLVMAAVGCGLLIAKTLGMEAYAKDYKQRIRNWDDDIFTLECNRKKPTDDEWIARINKLKKYNKPDDPDAPPSADDRSYITRIQRFRDLHILYDPSGYVYEAVTDNRVEGATATIYYEGDVEDVYGDTHKGAIQWDAESYGQVNPQTTDAEGRYNWDTPQGLWQVKIEKNGYETALSEWLPVPPPQLDVNIGIRQLAQPTVKKAIAYEDGVEVEFSKYMHPQTLTGEHIWLTRDGQLLPSNPWQLNTSKNWEGDASYVSRILVHPDEGLKAGDKVTLTVRREVESYAGVQMASDFQQEFIVTSRVRQIATDSLLEVPMGGERQFRVVATPASAAVGKRVTATLQHGFMATVTEAATFDDKGVALLTLHGLSGGSSSISFVLEEDEEVKTDATVTVLDPNAIPVAAPMASRISGTGVLPGDLLELWCDTEGATIWYTTDGSCPCDENGSRKAYSEPIVLNPPVTIRAYAVKGDQPESRVMEFHYNLWTGIHHTNANAPSVEGFYDTSGRRINLPQRGVNVVRMSDGTTHKIVVR